MATFLERVASRSMTSVSVAQDGSGSGVRSTYIVANDGPSMFKPALSGGAGILEGILGTANVGTRKLARVLPLAHPLMPWMYASRITSIQGVGRADTRQAAGAEYEVALITSETAAYPYYEFGIEFTPRMYSVHPDEAIYDAPLTWYDVDGSPVTTQVQEEWRRFTDYEIRPNPEIITAQQGQSFFATSDDDLTPTPAIGDASNPHGFSFQGFPRICVPRAQIIFKWFQVPFRYVDSPDSYLTEFIGRVNQNKFLDWPAGSLLYEGLSVRRYPPAAPTLTFVDGGVGLSTEKLCDIEFQWSYVRREQEDVPNFSAINPNWIAAGHNLMPWMGDRNFYHAVYPLPGDTNETSGWKPTFESVPFELLFQNPDWE